MKLFKSITKLRIQVINHYNPKKYWKYRARVVNCHSKRISLIKYLYLNYIKKTDAFNCAFISTHFGGGALFKTTPNLPHGLNGIVIGDWVFIGEGCTIMHRVTISEGTKDNPTVIGDNVFIGTGAVIRSGRKIGDNVKIGANAVVTHDIPSNCVVGGVPAKILKNNNVNS